MSIGSNISLITAGAVLTFATHVHTPGVSVQAVGVVLMLVGAASLMLRISALAGGCAPREPYSATAVSEHRPRAPGQFPAFSPGKETYHC